MYINCIHTSKRIYAKDPNPSVNTVKILISTTNEKLAIPNIALLKASTAQVSWYNVVEQKP
ncbi:MAG: hypothetical protein WA323_11615 [Candidatus Nitrosopolaris sp.]